MTNRNLVAKRKSDQISRDENEYKYCECGCGYSRLCPYDALIRHIIEQVLNTDKMKLVQWILMT